MGLAPLVWTFDDEEAKSKAARQATLYRSQSDSSAASHALQERERQQRGKPRSTKAGSRVPAAANGTQSRCLWMMTGSTAAFVLWRLFTRWGTAQALHFITDCE
jgi:hypothetical protein